MKKLLVLFVPMLFACASTGIVAIGGGNYPVAKTSPACGFRSADDTKAGAFCVAKHMDIMTVNITARDGVIGVRCASAELQFTCVPPR